MPDPVISSVYGSTMDRPLALIFALNEEVKPLLKEITRQATIHSEGTTIIRGTFRENPITLCRTGVGMGNAHAGCLKLIDLTHPSLILSVGFAGGLRKDLQVGDLILPNEIRSEAGELFSPDFDQGQRLSKLVEETKIPSHTGPLLTASSPLKTSEEKAAAGGKGPIAVDMESAPIAAICQKKGIPFVSLRVVFDHLDIDASATSFLKLPKTILARGVCQRNLEKVLTPFLRVSLV